jgi:hypothetical protein
MRPDFQSNQNNKLKPVQRYFPQIHSIEDWLNITPEELANNHAFQEYLVQTLPEVYGDNYLLKRPVTPSSTTHLKETVSTGSVQRSTPACTAYRSTGYCTRDSAMDLPNFLRHECFAPAYNFAPAEIISHHFCQQQHPVQLPHGPANRLL